MMVWARKAIKTPSPNSIHHTFETSRPIEEIGLLSIPFTTRKAARRHPKEMESEATQLMEIRLEGLMKRIEITKNTTIRIPARNLCSELL
jgi:hypothetical protein